MRSRAAWIRWLRRDVGLAVPQRLASRFEAYVPGVKKRTTVRVDLDLVRAAATVLGTGRTTDTIHLALAEVVRSRHRLAFPSLHPDLTLDDLDVMRRHGFDAPAAPDSEPTG